ncbi:hypothetical protein Peur_016767 [Populus x canadensis]
MASRDKKPAKPSSSGAGSIRSLSDLDRWSLDLNLTAMMRMLLNMVCSSKILQKVMMWMQFSIKLDSLEPLKVLWRILINLQVEEALLELSIRKSECPKELEPADRRSSVHVNLTRRDQNCPNNNPYHMQTAKKEFESYVPMRACVRA